MADIPIAEQFPSSGSEAVKEMTTLAQLLSTSSFSDQVQIWATKTGAGASDYVTALAKDKPFAKNAPGVPIVAISCERTPKSIEVAGWKALSPLKWQYTIPASKPAKVINVQVMAYDRLKFEAVVGACLKCMVVEDKATEESLRAQIQNAGRLTLGLLFRHRGTGLWAILVAHAFGNDTTTLQRSLNYSSKNILIACKPQGLSSQCAACMASNCALCDMQHWQFLAQGKDAIFRTIWRPDPLGLQDLSIAKISDCGGLNSGVKPLNVQEFAQSLVHAKNVDADFLTIAITQAMKLKGVDKRCATFRFMQQLLLDGAAAIMFKKGFKTGWTWGFLLEVNEKIVKIISPYTGGAKLSEPGDCGATWFVIDPYERNGLNNQKYLAALPVACHFGTDLAGYTNEHSVNFDVAVGQPYWRSFGDVYSKKNQTIQKISEMKTEDISINMADSFSPIV